jgi:hypothetical protein
VRRPGGKPPAIPPPSPAPQQGQGAGAIRAEQEQLLLELGQQLHQARKEREEQLLEGRARREKEERKRRALSAEEELRARLERLPRGPNLPPYKRHNAAIDVLQEELEDVIPDGWGSWWPEECERLGRRMGVPPAAVPLLMILEWCFGLRPPARKSSGMTAGSLCASPEWLARKVGRSERWIQHLTNRLDPWAAFRRERAWWRISAALLKARGKEEPPEPKPVEGGGTAYLQRHPRVRLYKALQREVPAAARLEKWMDASGKLHDWLDLRARWYPTVMGVRALRRRARRSQRVRPGQTPKLRRSPMQEDLYRRLAPLYRRIRARLAIAFLKHFTPKDVQLALEIVFRGARHVDAGPDPPEGGGAPAARRRRPRHERAQVRKHWP